MLSRQNEPYCGYSSETPEQLTSSTPVPLAVHTYCRSEPRATQEASLIPSLTPA